MTNSNITRAGIVETDKGATIYLLDGDLRIEASSRKMAIQVMIAKLKTAGYKGRLVVSNGPHFEKCFEPGDCPGL